MDPLTLNGNLVKFSPTPPSFPLHKTKLAEHGTKLRLGLETQKKGATQSRLPAIEKDYKEEKGVEVGHAAGAAQALKV